MREEEAPVERRLKLDIDQPLAGGLGQACMMRDALEWMKRNGFEIDPIRNALAGWMADHPPACQPLDPAPGIAQLPADHPDVWV